MSSVLTVNGSAVDRDAAKVVLDRLTLSMDRPGSLEFTEVVASAGDGAYHQGQTCVLTVDGAPLFSGRIVSSQPTGIGSGPVSIGYRALDLRYWANQIPVTSTDGTGVVAFNLPSSDPAYLASRAGRSVGAILKTLLDLHATALSAVGVTGYTAGELSALEVVPPEPVVAAGRLWSAVEQILARWCNKYAVWIDGSGLVHVVDTIAGLTARTLTLDSDPVVLGSVTRDHAECFTKVVVRGGADVEGAYLSLADGSLVDASSPLDKAAWTVRDFYQPKDAADSGSISASTSTTITVSSDVATRTWAVNYWSDQAATVWAVNPSGTGIAFNEQRRITACTAMTAGGSATITVDVPFNNSGYTKYVIRGARTAKSMVWRKYTIPNDWIAQHLQPRFSHSVPFSTSSSAVALTWTATAVVRWSQSGSPPYNEFPATLQTVLYDGTTDGYILFDQPVVFAFNGRTDLEAGGSAVKPPDDLVVLAPYSRGAISATKPDSGYEGTAYTVDGVARTLTIDHPDWLDVRNATQMGRLAQEVLDTVKDTIVEGTAVYLGKYSDALTLGKSLNIAIAGGGTTGWESLAAPVRTVSLVWPRDGAAAWTTTLEFSTRRRPFAGDRLYVHPNFGQAGTFPAPAGVVFAGSALDQGARAGGDGTGFDPSRPATPEHGALRGPSAAAGDQAPSRSGRETQAARDRRRRDARIAARRARDEARRKRARATAAHTYKPSGLDPDDKKIDDVLAGID